MSTIFKQLFDLSLRHKLPIWGSLLIICTAFAISAGYLYQAVGNIKQNMLLQSGVLGKSLAGILVSNIEHHEEALAGEIIQVPFDNKDIREGFQVEHLLVINRANRVTASTARERFPLHAELLSLGPEFETLSRRLGSAKDNAPVIVEGAHLLMAIPLVANGVIQGHLVLVHSADFHMARFRGLARRTALITLMVLAVVLPASWYWGRRMAVPLVMLAKRMGAIGYALPMPLPVNVYPYGDEVGQLFEAYRRMCEELEEKEKMKQEMIRTERLAALGRLSAGVAHEINNPLAGLITAVDTMRRHGGADPVAARTLPLIERGLEQIKEIVGALLVETRAQNHPLTATDIEDVQTLLSKEAGSVGVQWTWVTEIEAEIPLPSTLVRQVLINLLLNAIQAAGKGGKVVVEIRLEQHNLIIKIANDGQKIPAEVREHLFEPFAGTKDGGHGLGLWVTYQIVQQLHGHIGVEAEEGETRFVVTLPAGAAQ